MDEKQVEMLVTRIATLEKELRSKPAAPAVDEAAVRSKVISEFAHALLTDSVGTLKSMGAKPEQIEVIRAQMIADKLGDQAPPQMRFIAQQGPQMMQQTKTEEAIAALSRQVAELAKANSEGPKLSKFDSIIETEKSKYPNLAEALKADKEAIVGNLKAFGGSAEEFIAAQEAQWAKFGLAAKAAASAVSAETTDNQGQSTKTTPAPLASNLVGGSTPAQTPAAQPEKKTPVWNAETHKALVAELVQKTASKVVKA